ncbi:MAG TPA: hypothetical protein VIU34_31255, partial [Steroidobacter sp.]
GKVSAAAPVASKTVRRDRVGAVSRFSSIGGQNPGVTLNRRTARTRHRQQSLLRSEPYGD